MNDQRGMAETDPDLELVTALQAGEDSALDELIERYRQPIFGFIYRHVLNEADARELTQEVFVRLYFGIAKFRPKAKFTTWLYRIALNLCCDHARSKRTRQAAITESLSAEAGERFPRHDIASGSPTPAGEALINEKLEALERGIASLPQDLRMPLIMTALEQRSHRESAEVLKITPKAVEMRVYRARRQLCEWMAKAGFVLLCVNFFS